MGERDTSRHERTAGRAGAEHRAGASPYLQTGT